MTPARGKPPARRPVGSDAELDRIVRQVASRHRVSVRTLRSHAMPKRLRDARDEAIARAYATDNHSSLRLGQYFDGRDHATILEAVDRAYRRGVR